jgi:hypothetical protein
MAPVAPTCRVTFSWRLTLGTVNLNLRRELQIMRDELGGTGYEAYF